QEEIAIEREVKSKNRGAWRVRRGTRPQMAAARRALEKAARVFGPQLVHLAAGAGDDDTDARPAHGVDGREAGALGSVYLTPCGTGSRTCCSSTTPRAVSRSPPRHAGDRRQPTCRPSPRNPRRRCPWAGRG